MKRTEIEAREDLAACDTVVEQLKESHNLRRYWAEAVYYGELSVEDAIKAQEEQDSKNNLNESFDTTSMFITSAKDLDSMIESLNKI